MYNLVVDVFKPTDYEVVKTCPENPNTAEIIFRCGQAQSHAFVVIFDSGYVNYDALTTIDEANYTGHKLENIGGHQFFYHHGGNPETATYHINLQDKKRGLDFFIPIDLPETEEIVRQLLTTLVLEP